MSCNREFTAWTKELLISEVPAKIDFGQGTGVQILVAKKNQWLFWTETFTSSVSITENADSQI